MRLPPGLRPGPRWGAYSAPQTPSWKPLGHAKMNPPFRNAGYGPVAARGNATLEIIIASIGNSLLGNTEVRCDTDFSIDTYVKQKSPFYPFVPLLGVLSWVKVSMRLLPLYIPYSATLRYDMTLVLALRFLHKYMPMLLPHFVTTFGVAVRGKATLKIRHWSVRTGEA